MKCTNIGIRESKRMTIENSIGRYVVFCWRQCRIESFLCVFLFISFHFGILCAPIFLWSAHFSSKDADFVCASTLHCRSTVFCCTANFHHLRCAIVHACHGPTYETYIQYVFHHSIFRRPDRVSLGLCWRRQVFEDSIFNRLLPNTDPSQSLNWFACEWERWR